MSDGQGKEGDGIDGMKEEECRVTSSECRVQKGRGVQSDEQGAQSSEVRNDLRNWEYVICALRGTGKYSSKTVPSGSSL